jgi:hypothetical protein
VFALVLPAALVAPKATKREAQLAEQWEREIQLNTRLQTAGQTARLEALETAWGARGEAWRQTERLSPVNRRQELTPPKSIISMFYRADGAETPRRMTN